jgi:hypothetical protein
VLVSFFSFIIKDCHHRQGMLLSKPSTPTYYILFGTKQQNPFAFLCVLDSMYIFGFLDSEYGMIGNTTIRCYP